jgi:flagellar basal body-associated protein FliL
LLSQSRNLGTVATQYLRHDRFKSIIKRLSQLSVADLETQFGGIVAELWDLSSVTRESKQRSGDRQTLAGRVTLSGNGGDLKNKTWILGMGCNFDVGSQISLPMFYAPYYVQSSGSGKVSADYVWLLSLDTFGGGLASFASRLTAKTLVFLYLEQRVSARLSVKLLGENKIEFSGGASRVSAVIDPSWYTEKLILAVLQFYVYSADADDPESEYYGYELDTVEISFTVGSSVTEHQGVTVTVYDTNPLSPSAARLLTPRISLSFDGTWDNVQQCPITIQAVNTSQINEGTVPTGVTIKKTKPDVGYGNEEEELSTTQADDGHDDGGLSVTLIIVIAVVAFVVIAVIVIGIFFFLKRKKKGKQIHDGKKDKNSSSSDSSSISSDKGKGKKNRGPEHQKSIPKAAHAASVAAPTPVVAKQPEPTATKQTKPADTKQSDTADTKPPGKTKTKRLKKRKSKNAGPKDSGLLNQSGGQVQEPGALLHQQPDYPPDRRPLYPTQEPLQFSHTGPSHAPSPQPDYSNMPQYGYLPQEVPGVFHHEPDYSQQNPEYAPQEARQFSHTGPDHISSHHHDYPHPPGYSPGEAAGFSHQQPGPPDAVPYLPQEPPGFSHQQVGYAHTNQPEYYPQDGQAFSHQQPDYHVSDMPGYGQPEPPPLGAPGFVPEPAFSVQYSGQPVDLISDV